MYLIKNVTAAVFLSALVSPLLANTLERGVQLFNSKSYQQAAAILDTYANQGNEVALKLMSQAYQFGRGVPKDTARSLDYLKRAAKIESDGWANFALGMFHLKGSSGAPLDPSLGVSYLERSRQLGHPRALEILSEVASEKYKPKDANGGTSGSTPSEGIDVETESKKNQTVEQAKYSRNSTNSGAPIQIADLLEFKLDSKTPQAERKLFFEGITSISESDWLATPVSDMRQFCAKIEAYARSGLVSAENEYFKERALLNESLRKH